MILLKRHQCAESPAHYRPTRRRRLNDPLAVTVLLPESSAMGCSSNLESCPVSRSFHPFTTPSTCSNSLDFCAFMNVTFPTSFVRKQPPPPQPHRRTVELSSLPAELLLNVLSNLPLVDIYRVGQTCREFNSLTQDSSLHRHLDLSGLCIRHPPASLASHLSIAHSLTIAPPPIPTAINPSLTEPDYEPTLIHTIRHLPFSLNLTSLTLRGLPKKYITHLHYLFSYLKTKKLTHLDLARTFVTNHLVELIVAQHGSSLVELELEFATITDEVLRVFRGDGVGEGKGPRLTKLRKLGLAGCLGLSEAGVREFLCGAGGDRIDMGMGITVNVEVLDLRWGMDVCVEWIERWLRRRLSSHPPGATEEVVTGFVDLRGCERIVEREVQELRERWPGVEVRFTGKRRAVYLRRGEEFLQLY